MNIDTILVNGNESVRFSNCAQSIYVLTAAHAKITDWTRKIGGRAKKDGEREGGRLEDALFGMLTTSANEQLSPSPTRTSQRAALLLVQTVGIV